MRIAWFIEPVRKFPWQRRYNYNRVLASTWIRCLQLVPYLRASGVDSEINPGDPTADIALFLRRWGKEEQALARRLRAKGTKIILDTPVNYFSPQALPAFDTPLRKLFLGFAEIADAIFCPSPYIEQYGRQRGFTTVCMEDSVDQRHFHYRKAPLLRRDRPVLVWAGVSVKAHCLDSLGTLFTANSWPVVIISDKVPDLDFPFRFVPWKYERFPRDIVQGDIGIFPRQADNEYDSGHSFFKIGVFLAEHVPVIYSPLPSYSLVTTEQNSVSVPQLDAPLWEKAIREVASGTRPVDFAKNPVDDYSTEEIAGKYHRIFSQLLAS